MCRSFSIVIPTFNRPAQLNACLDSIASLDYPRHLVQVIVVNDGGPAPAPADGVLVLHQPHSGPAAARNLGAQHADGEILAFTDDDCRPAPDWLRRLDEQFSATPGDIVAGRVRNTLDRNVYAATTQLICDYLCLPTTNNLAVPAAAFRATGGFDASWPMAAAEDREFVERWRAQGRGISRAPAAVVDHAHNLSLRTFLRQHYGYGRGAYYFRRASRGAVRLEPASFYWDLLRFPAAQGRPGLVFPALLSQFATALGFLRQRLSA